jgi:aryl-alcohol dehydrogenase-like predicted oxidoreductase
VTAVDDAQVRERIDETRLERRINVLGQSVIPALVLVVDVSSQSMRYRLLGRSGLRVSELCLGTMTFGEDWGWGAPKDACAWIVDAFATAGGNFIDTSNQYTNGTAERIVGELIAPERERWVVSTKYALNRRPGDPNAGGSHRKSLVQSLDASLERLGTDYVDLYLVHVWDVLTPVEEVVRALDDVVRAGKVLYVGISDAPAWIVAQAVTLADERGWTRFSAMQAPYGLTARDIERDLVPMAGALDLTVMGWSPLGGGLLSGRYGSDRERPDDSRIATAPGYSEVMLTERKLAIADAVNRIAAERGASSAQVAIAWLCSRQQHAPVIPIVGARRPEQLVDTIGALDLELSTEELAALDEVSAIELGFPHTFVGRAAAYGETLDRVVPHRRVIWPDLIRAHPPA